jgi:hypothetical protein
MKQVPADVSAALDARHSVRAREALTAAARLIGWLSAKSKKPVASGVALPTALRVAQRRDLESKLSA